MSDCKVKVCFLFTYFPQRKAICLYFSVIPEIPLTERLQFRTKPTSFGLEVESMFYFQD